MTRRGLRYAGVAPLLVVAACGHGKPAPRFNAVDRSPSAAARFVDKPGKSDVTIGGELALHTTQDFTCSYAVDDFFIRGRLAAYDGVPVYVSINVEYYKRPGKYPKRTQLLIRRVSDDSSTYASWYESHATGTVYPNSGGADIDPVTMQPERGTQSTKPITVAGHFACEAKAKPGPG